MLEEILLQLKNSAADDWKVEVTHEKGWEFYYIRHDLDQNRAKDIESINVTVYKKLEDKYLGEASSSIAPTETKEEIKKIIDELVERASLVKNNIYALNEPAKAETLPKQEGTVSSVSKDFIETMNALPETATEDINSYEIFVSDKHHHLITSKGIDIESEGIQSMIEVVVNARNDAHEIELYRMYNSGTCDTEGLKRDLCKTLQYGKDRLLTVPTPEMDKTAVVFSTEDAKSIYNYFANRMDALLIVRQMSDWKIDEEIAEDVTGDKVTLKSINYLKNSSKNAAYDVEGAPIQNKTIIENNIPKSYYGNRMYSQYLGLKDSFIMNNYEVSGGTKTDEEIRSGRYLEIVEFSDFQVNEMTGDIFGEIRLGYLHDNDQTQIVTGGSISGSMKDYIKHMSMSKESIQYNNVVIPALTKLEDVTITGVTK